MKPSFEGFTNKKACGSGKTNFGNATPENVDNGVKFSSSGYINATGTSTKKNWYENLDTTLTTNSSGRLILTFPFAPNVVVITGYNSNHAYNWIFSKSNDLYSSTRSTNRLNCLLALRTDLNDQVYVSNSTLSNDGKTIDFFSGSSSSFTITASVRAWE